MEWLKHSFWTFCCRHCDEWDGNNQVFTVLTSTWEFVLLWMREGCVKLTPALDLAYILDELICWKSIVNYGSHISYWLKECDGHATEVNWLLKKIWEWWRHSFEMVSLLFVRSYFILSLSIKNIFLVHKAVALIFLWGPDLYICVMIDRLN